MGLLSIWHLLGFAVVLFAISYAIGVFVVNTFAARVPPMARMPFFLCFLGTVVAVYLCAKFGIAGLSVEFQLSALLVLIVPWIVSLFLLPFLGIGRAKDAGRELTLAKLVNVPFVGLFCALILLTHPSIRSEVASEGSP